MSIRYQLPNDKTILISYEEFDKLDSAQIQDLIADNAGMYIDDPFIKEVDKDRNYQKFDLEGIDYNELSSEEIEKIKKETED